MRINKRGNLMVAVILFILIFAGFTSALELSLSQRLEGKRFIQRDNAVYTADAVLDIYVYAAGEVLTANSYGPIIDNPAIDKETAYNEYVKTMSDAITSDAVAGQSLAVGSIYDIVSRLSLDVPGFRERMLDIMSDQVIISNRLLSGDAFQIDWENRETVVEGVTDEVITGVNPDPSDPTPNPEEPDLDEVLMLKPIRIEFTAFFRSFTVKKVISIYNVYIDVQEDGGSKTFVVNTDNLEFIVEEYDCYE